MHVEPNMNAKEQVRSALEAMPDTASIEDIREELLVLEGIQRGLDQADAGELVLHEEVEKQLDKWIGK